MARNNQPDDDDSQIIDVDATRNDLAKTADMPRDVMLLKMDHESIMAAAAVRPRDNAKVLKELVAMIDAYPAAADDAIYSKPVGTIWAIKCGKCGNRFESSEQNAECPKCGSQGSDKDEARKVKKYAEGLSIRAAETIRSIYGANSLRVAEEFLPDGKVRLIGIFVDYATATLTSDERIVSPWYKKRGGGMERIAEDRFLSLTVKAEKSKLRRDIILDAVPAMLKAAYRDACEKKIVQTVTAGFVEDYILPFLPQVGLNVEDAEVIVGKPRSMGWTNEDVGTLRKVCAALKNGEMTKAELFDELRDVREQVETTVPLAAAVPTGTDAADFAQPKGSKTKRPGGGKKKPEETPESSAQSDPEPELPTQEETPPVTQSTPEPEQPPTPAADSAPPQQSMFEGEAMDEELVDAYVKRIEKCATIADVNKAESEVKKLTMSIGQRALLMAKVGHMRSTLK